MLIDKNLKPNYILDVNWKHKFPSKQGFYWFYGERHGKDECKDIILCQCNKIANGTILIGDGQFIYESELGNYWFFAEANLPKLPNKEN